MCQSLPYYGRNENIWCSRALKVLSTALPSLSRAIWSIDNISNIIILLNWFSMKHWFWNRSIKTSNCLQKQNYTFHNMNDWWNFIQSNLNFIKNISCKRKYIPYNTSTLYIAVISDGRELIGKIWYRCVYVWV